LARQPVSYSVRRPIKDPWQNLYMNIEDFSPTSSPLVDLKSRDLIMRIQSKQHSKREH